MAAAPKTATFSLNDRGVRAVLYQIITIGSVILVAAYLVSNTMNNLETRQIQTGFGFLSQESGFAIAESLIDYAPSDTYGRAMVVGFLNTVKVSLFAPENCSSGSSSTIRWNCIGSSVIGSISYSRFDRLAANSSISRSLLTNATSSAVP